MSLLDEILAEKADETPRCSIAKMLNLQPEDRRKEIEEVIESEVPANRVVNALMKFRGIQVSDTNLRKHRRGDCRCKHE